MDTYHSSSPIILQEVASVCSTNFINLIESGWIQYKDSISPRIRCGTQHIAILIECNIAIELVFQEMQ